MNNLRVWHIPQVPMKPFYVPVDTPEEGHWVMDILARYDTFQTVNNVKPDYSNASGLEVFEDNEWITWYDDDGNDLEEYIELTLSKKESANE